ncbi:procathepsin L-like [Sitodiplosis mosellana]|uniref:procathepsin L-like n=1 Tax=Sitodiplosis mosellana TaxID=263140 RepID=UPI0024452A8C|nr:procathepsin L-like [Sitodiplosis mosellana]
MKNVLIVLLFLFLSLNKSLNDDEILASTFTESANIDLPESVDWRDKGDVTRVRDQGSCGSCYSFAVVGAIEIHYSIKTGHLLSLSEQNVIDCSKSYGNNGCNGGDLDSAMNYIRDHGIYTRKSYPYRGYDHHCMLRAKKSRVNVKGFMRIPSGNEIELQKALAFHGPVAVSIDSSHDTFRHYMDGIYHDHRCSSATENLDHSVLLVGYGTDEYDRDYYIAKNSYGDSWGDQGYFRISRNHNNHCGIATDALFPIV